MKIIDVNIDRLLREVRNVIIGMSIGAGILWLLWWIAVKVVCEHYECLPK